MSGGAYLSTIPASWGKVKEKNCLSKNGKFKPCRHFEVNMDHPKWARCGFVDIGGC